MQQRHRGFPNDLDQALTKVVGNGKSGNLELRQNTLKFSGCIWLV